MTAGGDHNWLTVPADIDPSAGLLVSRSPDHEAQARGGEERWRRSRKSRTFSRQEDSRR